VHLPNPNSRGGAFSTADRRRLLGLALTGLGLTLVYLGPLLQWARLATGSTMYSLVFLIPFITGYLIWDRRTELTGPFRSSLVPGALLGLLGLALLLWHRAAHDPGTPLHAHDRLALVLGSYLSFLVAAGFFLIGAPVLRKSALPVIFLIFTLPMPTPVEHALEIFFQYTSAEASALLFQLSGTPYLRDGLIFQLPGITLEVAQECSGINSSYVLFITSLLAGHLFLKKPWKRITLTLFVIPLAIVRNGFRILTIALLCVHVDPDMIHSWIHKRGGPVFFALSLIPFFLLLLWLRRGESAASAGRQVEGVRDER
jgi:exosortase C (VPDSG-CTERM-specific)